MILSGVIPLFMLVVAEAQVPAQQPVQAPKPPAQMQQPAQVQQAPAPAAVQQKDQKPAAPAVIPPKPVQKSKALPTLIVFDIVNEKGVEKNEAAIFTEIALDRITKLKKYTVVGQRDLEKMFAWEQNKQLKGCSDTSCLIQIAGAMGASYYVEGSIGVFGDKYIATLKLIDASDVKVIERQTAMIDRTENALLSAFGQIVDIVMGVQTSPLVLAASEKPVNKAYDEAQAEKKKNPYVKLEYPMNPYKKWGHASFWPGLGIGLSGMIFTALAAKANDDYKNGKDPVGNRSLVSSYNKAAISMYCIGGALMVTGIVLWSLSPGDEAWAKKHQVAAGPVFDGEFSGFAMAGKW